MSRRTAAPVREILPDPVYGSKVVEKFICRMMFDGKKSISAKILYDALEIMAQKTGEKPLDASTKALDNVKPSVEVKSKRVGGATYQVPTEIRESRREALAMRWIISASRTRNGKSMSEKLSSELLDAM
ncbi:MAG: 30S ribosomal protein S7, partial [Sphaerochaetaceae bacterium]|nr:30S ribosomal protein S7 [Sphaerochaetaceae bacterium]